MIGELLSLVLLLLRSIDTSYNVLVILCCLF
jgi:hypothetical protein